MSEQTVIVAPKPPIAHEAHHEELGFWRTTLVNATVIALAGLGWPRERLARLYGGPGA